MVNLFITSRIGDEELARLAERCRVTRGGWGSTGVRLQPGELAAAASQADILIVGYEAVPAWVMDALPQLKLLGCPRSNPVNVDLQAATERHIPVLHTPGRTSRAAAEFTFGLMLAEARHIARAHHALRSGHYLGKPMYSFDSADQGADIIWQLDGDSPFKQYQGSELGGHTLGLIGLGNIGSRVAHLARAFEMTVLAFSPYTTSQKAAQMGVRLASLDDLLRSSDFLSIHCPVSDETRGLLGRRELSMLKPDAYLINMARAVIIDQAALIEVLQQRRIAGAALDVFWYEPLPADHPLLNLDNVTITPHLAGASREVVTRHGQMIVADVLAWLDGRRPVHIANPDVWPQL